MVKGWLSTALGQMLKDRLVAVQTGPFGTVLAASEYVKHGIPVVSVREIRDGYIKIYPETPCVNVNTVRRLPDYALYSGDLVIARKGSIDRCAIISKNFSNLFLGSDAIRIRFLSSQIDPVFIFYYFHSNDVKNLLIQGSYGTTMAGLNEAILSSIPVRYPKDTTEQRRIAEALSDTDALLAALEKLIAKKRAIKQGTMQELLTGKRRLPGFKNGWIPKRFGDGVLKVRHGKSQHEIETSNGKYPILATGGEIGRTNFFLYDKPSVLIGRKGTIDQPQYMDSPFWTIDTLFYTDVSDEYFVKYIYYIFCTIDWSSHNEASGVPSLSSKRIEDIEIFIPSNRKEQIAIAEILSDMDVEIDALTAKLDKLRNIKQGMMAELLTGRIRLSEQETEATPEAVTTPKITVMPKHKPKAVDADSQPRKHSQQFDDAVMIAAIVDTLYSEKFPLGRKRLQKCLYLLRRHQDESTAAFLKKAAGPYADQVRYKGGEPIAQKAKYIATTTIKGKGTTFACGEKIDQALEYIQTWSKESDIQWVANKLKFKKTDDLELLATVDMAMCDLVEAGIPVSVDSIKHLIATNEEWKAKLDRQTFSDANIARAIRELQTLL